VCGRRDGAQWGDPEHHGVENASRYARYIASGQQRVRMKDRPVSYRTKQTPSQDLVYGRGGNWVRASHVSRFVCVCLSCIAPSSTRCGGGVRLRALYHTQLYNSAVVFSEATLMFLHSGAQGSEASLLR